MRTTTSVSARGTSKPRRRAGGIVLAWLGLLLVGGCGWRVESVEFPIVRRVGVNTVVSKYWCGAPHDAEMERAFVALQRGDKDAALEIVNRRIERSPACDCCHYDRAILYEMSGDWARARLDIIEALRLDAMTTAVTDETFVRERRFIEVQLNGPPSPGFR